MRTVLAGVMFFGLRLSAQTTISGTYNGTTISGDVVIAASTNATFTGGASFSGPNATFNANSGLYWQQVGALNGKTITLGSGAYLYVSGSNNTLSLDAATTLTGQLSLLTLSTTGTSITNAGTLNHTSTGSGDLYAPSFTNSGSITATAGSLNIGATNATYNTFNSGTITANGAATTIYLQGNVSNTGTLRAQNSGTLRFYGNNSSANLGTVDVITGGHAFLTGTLTNTSATLAAPTNGSFELLGGTINGGTVDAGALKFTNSGGLLNNVSLTGNLTLPVNSWVRMVGGATNFTGSAATLGNNSNIYWQQSATLSGKALTFDAGSGSYIYLSATGSALTLDSASSATGAVQIFSDGSTGSALTNQGNITHTSGYGYLYARNFSNTGNITNSSAGNYLQIGNTPSGFDASNAGGNIVVNGANSTIYLDGNFTNTGGNLTATNGQFYFRGNNTSANLNGGTLNIASGAHAYLNGTITNTGGSATLNAPTSGSYELYGGTINDGTIAANALKFTGSGGTLSNVSFTGDLNLAGSASVTFTNGTSFTGANLTLGNYATLNWNQNGTLTGKAITLGSAGAYGTIYVGNGNALTLGSGTTVTGDVYLYGTTGSSLTNQGTITQTSGTGYFYGPTVSNQGSITANSASSLYVGYYSGESTTNASGATITASGTGANIYLQGIVNQGTLAAQNNGALYFQGTSNTVANIGTVQLATGGHAYLGGTLTNTGGTLNAPTGGSYELYGGTINGGTIAAGALTFTGSGGTISGATLQGTGLTLPASTSVTLSNVSVPGNITVGNSASVTFNSNTSFPGANLGLGTYSTLTWNQNGTLAGKSITAGSGGAYGYLSVGSGNSLTLGSGTSLTGVFDLYGNSGSTIINQGTITANSGTSYAYGPTFTNQGTITANSASLYVGYYSGESTTNASGATITANGTGANIYFPNLVNQGTVTAQNNGALYFQGTALTTANLNGGTINIASGGHAYLNGTLTNTGATLNAPSSGSYELYGGTILGGSVATGALAFTTSGGYLDGVSLLDNLTLGSSAYVRFLTGAGFTGATANLAANSGVYWQQSGTLTGKTFTLGTNAYLYVTGANHALTLAPSTSIVGTANVYTDGSSGSTITNQGNITHTSGSGSLYGPTFTNSGNITATGGTLYLGYPSTGYTFTNSGNITVNGSGASVWLQTPAASPFANTGSLTLQSGSLGSSTPVTNSGNLSIAAGTTFNDTGGTSFTQTAGALKIDGSFLAPGGGVSIQGGTVSGLGNISGNTTFTSGTLDPGSTIGTLTFTGNLTLTGGATTNLELGAGVNDRVTVTGSGNSLVFGGTLNILAVSTAFASGQTWTVFSFPAHSGSFATINLPYGAIGWVWDTSNLTTTGALTLATFVPIPEPSSYVLLAGGLGALLLVHRRRAR